MIIKNINYAIFCTDLSTEDIVNIKKSFSDIHVGAIEYNYYFLGRHNLTESQINETVDEFFSSERTIFIIDDIATFSYIDVSPNRKLIYIKDSGKLVCAFSCIVGGVPGGSDSNTLLEAYMNGMLDLSGNNKSESETIEDVIKDWALMCGVENELSKCDIDSLVCALIDANIRYIGKKGVITVEGEVSIVPPHVVEKVRRILR